MPEQILIWSGIYNTYIWIRSPISIKHYLLIVIEFFSELKVSCGLSNNNHCKLLMANVLQWKQGTMLIRRLWWGWSHTIVGHLFWNVELLFIKRWSGIAHNLEFWNWMCIHTCCPALTTNYNWIRQYRGSDFMFMYKILKPLRNYHTLKKL